MDSADMVRMANQIASFFKAYGHEQAMKDTAEHINKFWVPGMRASLLAHIQKGGAGLDAIVVDAAGLIRKPKADAA